MSTFFALAALSQIFITTPANLSLNLSPAKRETLNFPPSLQGKGARGLGLQASANTKLFDQGLKLYQVQKYSEAARLFQEAATAYGNSGDKLNQALSWNYLSLSYQELGQVSEAGIINESIKLLQSKSGSKEYLSVRAQAFNTLGKLQLAQGQPENALLSWQEAINIYSQIQDSSGKIGTQINQAQALQALGLFRRARNTLENVNLDLEKQQDTVLKATGLLSLGNAMRVVGDLDSSLRVLDNASKLASSKEILAEILLSKGNTVQAQKKTLREDGTTEAIQLYQQAAATSEKPTTQVQAQLNILRLLVSSSQPDQWRGAQTLSQQLQAKLDNLPPSHSTVYARINFAQSLIKLANKTDSTGTSPQDACTNGHPICTAAKAIVTGIKQAQSLKDLRAEAYAVGTLGNLYEQTQQWTIAENLSKQALKLSEGIQAKDISARWLWQLGRIKSADSNPERNQQQALVAYEQTVNILISLRRDLASVSRDVQFSFREEVEPVYRQYVRLLLLSQNGQPDFKTLEKARKTIEALQVAELNNFFRSACVDAQPVEIKNIDRNQATSVIYPFILSDRLAVITWFPNQPQEKSLKLHTINISQSDFEKQVSTLRQQLTIRSTYEFLPLAQNMYNWLIRPIEADLQNSRVRNLVFVLDGRLQGIPMAALHDAQKNEYLVQKGYDIALTPGLELLPFRNAGRVKQQGIIAGINQPNKISNQTFPELPAVTRELETITKNLSNTKELLNNNFTPEKFEQAVTSFPAPIVHLATHGKFSSRAEDTFILAWAEPVTIKQLDSVLKARESQQQAIDLLVLSACQTAVGDERAALGLAGIAVQSGARSTIGSLWSVNDDATTDLMIDFYKEYINNQKTRGEALRLAQTSLLSGDNPTFKHPYYWAPFVLVGNWQ
ncbi:hypothetical protein NIES4071_86010 [Calothrix sp. NIES-4071]|nr:hypothetical protein NIES4071_86010 [Calothrix sp. NIES-4071]BAZ62868.1 hypothetical protein NIES4105_85940 [Calothrix sp. NIES-4105]